MQASHFIHFAFIHFLPTRRSQPSALPAGLDRLGGRRVRRAHHAAPEQHAAQQNVLPQQGGGAGLQTAARLHQRKAALCRPRLHKVKEDHIY